MPGMVTSCVSVPSVRSPPEAMAHSVQPPMMRFWSLGMDAAGASAKCQAVFCTPPLIVSSLLPSALTRMRPAT